MLTVDHVKLRRKKGVVEVVPLCGVKRERAVELAGFAVDVAKDHEGMARAWLEEALDELPVEQDEVRFGRGLKKLVLDACSFDVDTTLDPEAVRADVFRTAATTRASTTGTFDRAAVVAAVAAARQVSIEELERALYADLDAAHAVRGLELADGAALIERYAVSELQAVLLRAVRVVLDVDATAPELRALLRALKFTQLLFELDGDKIVVEGPMGMFQQSTRYGLKLAMLLPHLMACKRWRVDATVKLRKGGGTERLVLEGKRAADAPPVEVAEAVRLLVDEVGAPWQATPAGEVIKHPGGAFVPDIRLEHQKTGDVVYVEILGFWSRAAVWKRVELVEQGLPFRVVFCASERLRVSEQALPEDAPSALVVYKGVLRAKAVVDAANRVIESRR